MAPAHAGGQGQALSRLRERACTDMPIVNVQVVCSDPASVPGGLAQALADGIGAALQAQPGSVWVTLDLLPRERYAENHVALADGDLPVFVTVLMRRLPPPDDLRAQVASLARAVGQATGRGSGRAHVILEPAGAGRVAFGGDLQA